MPSHKSYKSRPEGSFHTLLRLKGLWPPDPTLESDWSGKGQHVEFQRHHRDEINRLLQVKATLGSTNSAVVESVKCKRIYLARKTIFCGRHFTKEQAIEEVAHLEKIQHSHIVRVIGTYTIANQISILLYPVAEYNLETFLRELIEHCMDAKTIGPGFLLSVSGFFGCLSGAVAFIHSKMTKHMDIKPKNILVRKIGANHTTHKSPWKVYIADFGIARSYSSLAASETEGPTMFTRKYAAPEVVDRDKRGFPADVFSLGCVFVEIAAAIVQAHMITRNFCNVTSKFKKPIEELETRLAANEFGDMSYQANIPEVQQFVLQLNLGRILRYYLQFRLKFAHDAISEMLDPTPGHRPTARILAAYFGDRAPCCLAADTADPLEDSKPMMDEEFEDHLRDFGFNYGHNRVERPPSPVDLGGEKRSSYRMSNVDLSSTSSIKY